MKMDEQNKELPEPETQDDLDDFDYAALEESLKYIDNEDSE